MAQIPRMIVSRIDAGAAPADDVVSYVRAMVGELAVMCAGAGRPDAALVLLRVALTLQRPLAVQPPEANAAPGDAA